jgi:hypothetical protein
MECAAASLIGFTFDHQIMNGFELVMICFYCCCNANSCFILYYHQQIKLVINVEDIFNK